MVTIRLVPCIMITMIMIMVTSIIIRYHMVGNIWLSLLWYQSLKWCHMWHHIWHHVHHVMYITIHDVLWLLQYMYLIIIWIVHTCDTYHDHGCIIMIMVSWSFIMIMIMMITPWSWPLNKDVGIMTRHCIMFNHVVFGTTRHPTNDCHPTWTPGGVHVAWATWTE